MVLVCRWWKGKEDKRSVGMCGLIKRDTLETPDIGFAFLPEYCGKGYALEIATATVEYAKSLGISKLAAITIDENTRSIQLLEKIGLQFVKKIVLPPSGQEVRLYTN